MISPKGRLTRIGRTGRLGVLAVSVGSLACACGQPQVTSPRPASSPTAPGAGGTSGPTPTGGYAYPPTTMAGPFPFGQNPLGPSTARYPSLESVRGPVAAVVARLHAKVLVVDPAVVGHDFTYYFNGTALAAVRPDLTVIEQTGAWLGGRGYGEIFTRADGFQYGLFSSGDTEQLWFGQNGTIVEP